VDRVLAYTAYVRLASHRVRQVALTFDDGPSEHTPAILRILRRTHTPATFFVIGRLASRYPRLIVAEARAGFEIGDHTETHPYLAGLPAAAQATQITTAADAIRHAGGPTPRLFRPPYGSFDRSTVAKLRQQGMLMVLWSADTKDYARPGVGKIVYTALSGAQPGAIIVMHDGGGDRRQTVAALPRIIRGLRRRGYRLVTVAQLIASDPPPHGQPSPRPLSGGV
jgi:peptidoglycan/xylan/chitin deacetylase (PgdA/CDA1 family)